MAFFIYGCVSIRLECCTCTWCNELLNLIVRYLEKVIAKCLWKDVLTMSVLRPGSDVLIAFVYLSCNFRRI